MALNYGLQTFLALGGSQFWSSKLPALHTCPFRLYPKETTTLLQPVFTMMSFGGVASFKYGSSAILEAKMAAKKSLGFTVSSACFGVLIPGSWGGFEIALSSCWSGGVL